MFQWDIGPEPTEPYSNIHLMLLNGKTSYNFSMISPNIDVLYIPSLNLVLYCNRHCFISNPMCRVKTRKSVSVCCALYLPYSQMLKPSLHILKVFSLLRNSVSTAREQGHFFSHLPQELTFKLYLAQISLQCPPWLTHTHTHMHSVCTNTHTLLH